MLSASIAAASILAKTERDRVMREFDKEFPGYGFSQHKGYGTPKHYEMLKTLGVTPLHRRSFRPVRIIMGIEPVQTELFETEIARSAYH
jgi:ribonuclease HII